jgi:hypothetical protein
MSKSKNQSKSNSNFFIEYDKKEIEDFGKMFSLKRLREIKEIYKRHLEVLVSVMEDKINIINYIECIEEYIKNRDLKGILEKRVIRNYDFLENYRKEIEQYIKNKEKRG